MIQAAPVIETPEFSGTSSFYETLRPLCLSGLGQALNARTSIYDRQLRDKTWQATLGTEDLTSTAICLIGIDRAGIDPGSIGLNVDQTLGALIDLAGRHQYHGGLGLVVWANAVCEGPPLEDLLDRSGTPLNDLPAFIAPLTTMETAWLTSGLIHEWKRTGAETTRQLAVQATALLHERQHAQTDLMVHATASAPANHRVRKGIANFADQIYSVQAFAFAANAFGDEQSLDAAEACAARLVEFQGRLGQWWWHYNAPAGHVAQRYPVYAVHQHGMAPMALSALAAAGGTDHTAAADLSRAWLTHNELDVNLIDSQAETIWRDIEPDEGRFRTLARRLQSVAGWKPSESEPPRFKINFETRPYEWAWCLYAGAIAHGTPNTRHIV